MSSANLPEIKFTNTQTQKKEVFKTQVPGVVRFYSCGPTVYDKIHIGNLRSALVADLIYRYLTHVGYDVQYVRNYTDVDDRIIKKAGDQKRTSDQVSSEFIQEVEKDYAVSGVLDPKFKPKATEYVSKMVAFIEGLVSKGSAYEVKGEVFYSVDTFEDYGKLSRQKFDDLEAGHRVEVKSQKKNPLDFSLWKPAKPGEPSWDSPWGKGRPGWHIECSVMAQEILGDQIDLHHGGEDLIFPHHENEIAQSEAATGKKPFARMWLHHAFLTLSKEKMSKSLGNVFTARDFLTKFGGEVARYLLLSVHYRSRLDFSVDSLNQTLQSLERIYEAKKKALEITQLKTRFPDTRAESLWASFVMQVDGASKDIAAHFAYDLNTPGALASVFVVIREFNRILSEPKTQGTPAAILASQALIRLIEEDVGSVLGIGRLLPEKALEQFNGIRSQLSASDKVKLDGSEIEKRIAERNQARRDKDFKRSDEIRDELLAEGVDLLDGPSGTSWKYR